MGFDPSTTATAPPVAAAASRRDAANAADVTAASMPSTAPAPSSAAPASLPSHSATPATPGSPAFMSSQPSSSSRDAWSQYLPSVQQYAPPSVTSAVPALPVKPVANARRSKHGATYSLRCGSSLGMTRPSSDRARSSLRSDSSVDDDPPRRATERWCLADRAADAKPAARREPPMRTSSRCCIGRRRERALCAGFRGLRQHLKLNIQLKMSTKPI